MPRDGAIIFSDLIGKTEVLRVACDKCGRDGRVPVKKAHHWNDQCASRCPELAKVL
jgi:hypothetical protein